MKLFSNTRARRNTAFVVLLVWLFALGSGVANACLLEADEKSSQVATAESSKTTHASDVLAQHAVSVAGHGDDSHTSKEPCLKACDDGSRSLPTQTSGVDLNDPGPAPVVAVLWTTATRVLSAPRHMPELQPPAPGLPARTRYSRLAL